MKTGAPCWFKEVPDAKRYPTLSGDRTFDVAVTGGGIAGVSAAYFSARAGARTALLDSAAIGGGDTGFTTALVTRFLDDIGPTTACWAASDASVGLLDKTISEEGIDCDWVRLPSCRFTAGDAGRLRVEFESFRRLNPSLEFFEGSKAEELLGFPAAAAYRCPNEGRFHVRKFLVGLAERAAALGCEIFEDSEATGFEKNPTSVVTKEGRITADKIIVATGLPPKRFFPAAAAALKSSVSFVIQASYSRRPFAEALYWDDLEPYHYFRRVGDNDLILGGEDRPLGRTGRGADAHARLATWLESISGGAAFKVAAAWQGALHYSADGLPLIGAHREYGGDVCFLTGLDGNGMTLGFLGGRVAANAALGREEPFAGLFSFGRSGLPEAAA